MGSDTSQEIVVAQDFIYLALEDLQGWGIQYLCGKPVPVPHYPLSENFLSNL